MTNSAAHPSDRRAPFTAWDDIARLFTDHLEVQRFNQLPPHHRAAAWKERRKHAPCSEAVPPAWGLDALYLRHPDESNYCDRLQQCDAMARTDSRERLVVISPLVIRALVG